MIGVHSKIAAQLAPNIFLGYGPTFFFLFLFFFFKHYARNNKEWNIFSAQATYFPTTQDIVFAVNVLRKM
jgi:hypothetical protein